MPAVELEDPASDVVEEIPVVGHCDHRSGELVEVAFEPGHGFRIEMIGRLVEKQHVRRGQQEPTQRDAPALAAG